VALFECACAQQLPERIEEFPGSRTVAFAAMRSLAEDFDAEPLCRKLLAMNGEPCDISSRA